MSPARASAPRTAPAADQARLLEVQALDTRLAQLAHRRRTMPEHAALAALDVRGRALHDRLVAARTQVSDIGREAARADADVEAVRARAERTAARLTAGAGSAKDTQALAHEATSLAKRLGDLEEVELEVMQRQEDAVAALAALDEAQAQLEEERGGVTERRAARLADLEVEITATQQQRERAATGLDAALVAFYDRVREEQAGLGAAALTGDRCGGCRLQLTPAYLGVVRSAAPDAVVTCEECGRILVRPSEAALHR